MAGGGPNEDTGDEEREMKERRGEDDGSPWIVGGKRLLGDIAVAVGEGAAIGE